MYGSGVNLQERTISFICENCPTDIDEIDVDFEAGVAHIDCPNCDHPHVIDDRYDSDI